MPCQVACRALQPLPAPVTCHTPCWGISRSPDHAVEERATSGATRIRCLQQDEAGDHRAGSIEPAVCPHVRDEVTVGCGRRDVQLTAAHTPSSPQPSPTVCWMLYPTTSAPASQLPPLSWPQHTGKGPGAAPGASGLWAWHWSIQSRAWKELLALLQSGLTPACWDGQGTSLQPKPPQHPLCPAWSTQRGPAGTSYNGCPVPWEPGPAWGWVPEVSTLRPYCASQEGQRHHEAS